MTDLDGLIEELEKAGEGSRELDRAIQMYLTPPRPARVLGFVGQYTTSLDAALTLVPEGYSWYVSTSPDHSPGPYESYVQDGYKPFEGWQHAPTPALALCIAALRARQQMAEESHAQGYSEHSQG